MNYRNNKNELKKVINFNTSRRSSVKFQSSVNRTYRKLRNRLPSKTRSFSLSAHKMVIRVPFEVPEEPTLTGNFLVRENTLFIASENDKLIELDIS